MKAYFKLISKKLLFYKIFAHNFSQALRRNHPEMSAMRKCLSVLTDKSTQLCCTAYPFTCCCDNILLTYCFICCLWLTIFVVRCLWIFCSAKVVSVIVLPIPGIYRILWCFMFIVSIILSKFQPAVVLLSGLIFTCPVPSPAVTLRVKSTLLREFTQMTKVCEQTRNQATQTIHLLLSAWLHVGWIACMMWSSSLLKGVIRNGWLNFQCHKRCISLWHSQHHSYEY